jgi:hypothetical protein
MKKAAMVASVPSAEEIQAQGTIKAKQKGNTKRPWVSATFYIPRPTHRRLKEYANAYDTSLQQILEEAVDMWLASKNEPAFYPEGWSDDIGKKDIIE